MPSGHPNTSLIGLRLVGNAHYRPRLGLARLLQSEGVLRGGLHHGQREAVSHLQIQLLGNVVADHTHALLPRSGKSSVQKIEHSLLEGLQSLNVIAGVHTDIVVAQLILFGVLSKNPLVEHRVVIAVKRHPRRRFTALIEVRHHHGTVGASAVKDFTVQQIPPILLRNKSTVSGINLDGYAALSLIGVEVLANNANVAHICHVQAGEFLGLSVIAEIISLLKEKRDVFVHTSGLVHQGDSSTHRTIDIGQVFCVHRFRRQVHKGNILPNLTAQLHGSRTVIRIQEKQVVVRQVIGGQHPPHLFLLGHQIEHRYHHLVLIGHGTTPPLVSIRKCHTPAGGLPQLHTGNLINISQLVQCLSGGFVCYILLRVLVSHVLHHSNGGVRLLHALQGQGTVAPQAQSQPQRQGQNKNQEGKQHCFPFRTHRAEDSVSNNHLASSFSPPPDRPATPGRRQPSGPRCDHG